MHKKFTIEIRNCGEPRIALPGHHSSQCVAQGAYIGAMAVGFLVLLKLLPYSLDFAVSVDLRLPPELTRNIILSLMVSGFLF